MNIWIDVRRLAQLVISFIKFSKLLTTTCQSLLKGWGNYSDELCSCYFKGKIIMINSNQDSELGLDKTEKDIKLIDTAKENLPTLQSGQVNQTLLIDDLSASSSAIVADDGMTALDMEYDKGYIKQCIDGLYYIADNKTGSGYKRERICSPIKVVARSRNIENTQWCIVLEWLDKSNTLHNWSVPIELIQSDSRKYRRELARRGLVVSTKKHLQDALDFYLNNHPTESLFIFTNKVGWHDNVFVTPNKIYGKAHEKIIYQPESLSNHGYSERGTLEDWRDNLCSHLGAQSRLNFAISCAFTGPLLKILDIEGGGFHMLGKSSIGKSLSLYLSSSVWGKSDYVKNWNTTKNAAETLAAMCNDNILIMDEISQAERKDLEDIFYMLSNGRGKSRSTVDGGNRVMQTWKVLLLSSGEETLQSMLEQSNKRHNTGMDVRLCHIDADAGKNLGIFDSLVLANRPEEQSDVLTKLTGQYYGSAGTSWLNHITLNEEAVIVEASEIIEEFMSSYNHVKSQAYRVGKRFAVVAAAGELATKAGITGWQDGQAIAASKICFDNWLDNYGYDGKQEDRKIISQIACYLEKYAGSRFQNLENSKQKINNRSGYYKKDEDLYLFSVNAFKEICLPYSKRQVLNVLKEHDLIKCNEDKRVTLKLNNRNIDYDRAHAVKGNIMSYNI